MKNRWGIARGVSVCVLVAGALASVFPISTAAGAGNRRALADFLMFGPGLASHPVGVVPSADIVIPRGWPLDVDGSITCVSCHDLYGQNDHLLSMSNEGSALCLACHDRN